MQGTTRYGYYQLALVMLHGLAVVSLIGLALLGQVPMEVGGWVIQPALPAGNGRKTDVRRQQRWADWCESLAVMGDYLKRSWRPAFWRSMGLWGLWQWNGCREPGWLGLVPWGLWLWQGLGVGWPHWRRQMLWKCGQEVLWQGQRLLLLWYLGMALSHHDAANPISASLGLSCVVCGGEKPRVEVERQADGSCQAMLCGHFTLTVPGDQPFRMRLLVLFLSLLDVPGAARGSRRTRDGRTPFVRQLQLADWLGVPQPHISRWLKYWQAGDWANLLSLHSAEVLTTELVERIVEVCATFPTWGTQRVYHYLHQQGLAVTQLQVEQAVKQSGWQHLQQALTMRYNLTQSTLRLRDGWLVGHLLAQVRELLERLETGQQLPTEVRTTLADLTTVASEAGVSPPPPIRALPWLLRLEHQLLGDWTLVTDGQVCCPTCGSTRVSRKSAKPRMKRYYDDAHQLCEAAVYRHYCRNPQCAQGSFTNLPPGLLPYSRYRSEVHLLAVQMYAWGYSTYRRTGTALGVSSLTAWRWVSAWGAALLPVAALFGVVRCSGAIGVDEKYVLVPKNDKPAGKMQRWMYVYLAADAWTYDLLHIAIYPNNDQASATAFLLALRAKGYQPQVIVTDLRQDYGPVIAYVFPQAEHHECIFHALQQAQKHVKDAYGPDYAEQYPQAVRLKQLIYHIFDADSFTLAAERYAAVLDLRQDYVQARPEAAVIFDFLQHHWPKLANSFDSPLIPSTNNTVERVIGRFDQHYQNFCGFESIADAQCYLAVFEKLYRFTPFSQDAQPSVRGKSPLQLAGYDTSQLPMTTITAGLSIVWPVQTQEAPLVPSL
ncbi:MAG: transposase [Anaerolineae bacterium]